MSGINRTSRYLIPVGIDPDPSLRSGSAFRPAHP